MPLFKKEPAQPPGAARSGTANSAARDAFLHGLEDEIWRARRYDRPLSIVAATPRLLPAERLSPEETSFAAKTVREVLRRSDDTAWIDSGCIVGILPETNGDQARAAAYRLRTELERRAIGDRRVTWRVASVPLRGEEFARDLLDALLTELAAEVN